MGSTRVLSDKFAWTQEQRAIELLDWETRPEDFDRLCEHVIATLVERDGVSRQRLFSIVTEEEFRSQVRLSAQRFTEKFQSLSLYVYMRMKFLVLPSAGRVKKGGKP